MRLADPRGVPGLLCLLLLFAGGITAPLAGDEARPPATLERLRVRDDGKGFVQEPSNRPFFPLGFNYDHDETGRLIEDYWHDEWPKVEADFREMADLGANVVRVHLQFGKFMTSATEPDAKNLDRLRQLLDLAQATRLYLDLTGLGCYHKQDVPPWYDALDEEGRWAAQAAFWKAVAGVGKDHPAVFFYDLMNEPVVPGGKRADGDWLGPGFGDKFFVQFITLDQKGRPRPAIARAWVESLVKAIREVDDRTLITVGLVPWSLNKPGLNSGFFPEEVAGPLDFIAVHLYPEKGKVDEALETLEGFNIGKPVNIEDIFVLKCGPEELKQFVTEGIERGHLAGLIGFYWGKTLDEMTPPASIPEALTVSWLKLFQELQATVRETGKANEPERP